MERIIRGRRYNTATAEAVAEHEYVHPSDLEWMHEVLYRKRTGEYFLWGAGGPRSKYRKRVKKDVFDSGESIKPITLDEAKVFIKKYGTVETYKNQFEINEFDGETIQLNIYLSAPTFQRLKIASVERGESMTKLVSKLIDENL